ncbi:MAG TPA: hypothetical protein VGF69_15790 [Thermoanaerobaculia bacterium]|jgi:hypothetical protein
MLDGDSLSADDPLAPDDRFEKVRKILPERVPVLFIRERLRVAVLGAQSEEKTEAAGIGTTSQSKLEWTAVAILADEAAHQNAVPHGDRRRLADQILIDSEDRREELSFPSSNTFHSLASTRPLVSHSATEPHLITISNDAPDPDAARPETGGATLIAHQQQPAILLDLHNRRHTQRATRL